MKTIFKITALIVLFVSTTSCMMNGISGNGDIETQERDISEDFTAIKVMQGIDVYLTSNNSTKLTVEADENIIDLLRTDVNNGTLKIYFEKNVWRATSRKVYLSVPTLSSIVTTSGASVRFENTLKADKLSLRATSGADIYAHVDVTDLNSATTSGADIKINGLAKNFEASATSGSDIKASDLKADYVTVRVTSGADIRVYALKEINAKATSGGNIRYDGDPKVVNKTKNSGGRIRRD
ncbi:MAG: head GIN domain-containing protein [Flavobacteriaceae bacterium]